MYAPTKTALLVSLIAAELFSFGYITAPKPAPPNQRALEHFDVLTPNDLNMNAVVLPASGDTPFTNPVDTRGAKAITLNLLCNKDVLVEVRTTLEDGSTVFGAFAALETTTIPGGDHASININDTTAIIGTADNIGVVSSTQNLKLPQAGLLFRFDNQTAVAGTCTARVYILY